MLDVLYWILMVLYIPACLGLIVIVLLQKGKGTGFAGAFGIGAGSETVFGPRARKSLPVKLTYVAAAMFMVIALLMSMISGRVGKGSAPDLAEVTEGELAATSTLDELGIGSGVAGAAESETPAAEGAAEAPAEVESIDASDAEALETAPAEGETEPPAAEGEGEAAPAEAPTEAAEAPATEPEASEESPPSSSE